MTTAKFQNTKDFTMLIGALSGSALPTDSDPNTTEPTQARMSTTPKPTDDGFVVCSLVADKACTVEGWIWSEKIGRWFKLWSQALTADIVSQVSNVPINVPITLVISANGGSAKVVGAMFA